MDRILVLGDLAQALARTCPKPLKADGCTTAAHVQHARRVADALELLGIEVVR